MPSGIVSLASFAKPVIVPTTTAGDWDRYELQLKVRVLNTAGEVVEYNYVPNANAALYTEYTAAAAAVADERTAAAGANTQAFRDLATAVAAYQNYLNAEGQHVDKIYALTSNTDGSVSLELLSGRILPSAVTADHNNPQVNINYIKNSGYLMIDGVSYSWDANTRVFVSYEQGPANAYDRTKYTTIGVNELVRNFSGNYVVSYVVENNKLLYVSLDLDANTLPIETAANFAVINEITDYEQLNYSVENGIYVVHLRATGLNGQPVDLVLHVDTTATEGSNAGDIEVEGFIRGLENNVVGYVTNIATGVSKLYSLKDNVTTLVEGGNYWVSPINEINGNRIHGNGVVDMDANTLVVVVNDDVNGNFFYTFGTSNAITTQDNNQAAVIYTTDGVSSTAKVVVIDNTLNQGGAFDITDIIADATLDNLSKSIF